MSEPVVFTAHEIAATYLVGLPEGMPNEFVSRADYESISDLLERARSYAWNLDHYPRCAIVRYFDMLGPVPEGVDCDCGVSPIVDALHAIVDLHERWGSRRSS